MNLDELMQLQVLKRKAAYVGAHPGSTLLDDAMYPSNDPEIRQLCAKITDHLYVRVDEVCSALDLTKRQFVEWALADAVERADRLLSEHFGPLVAAPSAQSTAQED